MRIERTSINVFLSYAHKDEKMKNTLIEHMSVFKRQGIISISDNYSNDMAEKRADEYLDSADLILLLVSPAYIASDYCYEIEMHRAMERHEAGEARVIPIILSPCSWQETPLGKLVALPKHFKPITQWNHREEAFDHIVKNIRTALDELKQGSYRFTGATTTSAISLSELSPYTWLSVYMSYAWEDEPVEKELEAHLQMLQRQALINIWHPEMISAGREWAPEIYSHLGGAHIILLLVSQNYLKDDFRFQIELARAMERHAAGQARVIPIILSPCRWHLAPFARLVALPKHFKPITEWVQREAAFADIVKNLEKVVNELRIYGYSGSATSTTTTLSKFSPYSSLSVYISSAWEDELVEQELEAHLQMLHRQASINIWHPDMISAGEDYRQEIDKHLSSAHIILLLVSQNYLKDDFRFQIELARAMERHAAGQARVIPIILSPCDWQEAPFAKLFASPKHFKPITEWAHREAAFADITKNIRKVIYELERQSYDNSDVSTTSTRPLNKSGSYSSLSVYISFAWEDELVEQALEAHLQMLQRQASITIWHSDMISAGREWQEEIAKHLSSAHIILLLVSQNYIKDEFLFQMEMAQAMQRHEAGEARVIPIILSPCNWQLAPFGKLLALPKSGQPITNWDNAEAAFMDIVKNIGTVITELQRFGSSGATTMPAIPLSELSPHSPLSVYISYALADELAEREVEAHLQMLQRQASITIWHSGMISAGREWQEEIAKHLSSAHIILLLVSQNYLNSEFLFQMEMVRAMERHAAGQARVIPIILSPCDWQQASFGKLLALPKYGKPVAEWTNREAAFADIAENIHVVAEELRTQHLLTAKALLTFNTVNQMSQTEKEEELDRIERQLESSFESRVTRAVKKALRDSPQSKRNTAISTISLCCILILLFEMTVYYWLPSQLHWLIVHSNSFGIQLTIDTFVVLAIVGYMYSGKVRIWCWGAGIFAIFGIFLQIIGGPH